MPTKASIPVCTVDDVFNRRFNDGPQTADITAFTPTRIVARYSGTVAELFADFNAGTADRSVHTRPLTGLTTPRTTDRQR